MKKIRIILADDHSVVRSGLRSLFKTTKEFVVVGEASNGEDAVRIAGRLNPDIAILDISMPKLNGIEATRLIKENSPQIKVLILTIHANEEYIYEMIRAGANGYVLKDAEKKEIFTAVRTVAAAEPFFSPNISRLIIEKFVKRAKEPSPEKSLIDQKLTKREQEILRHIAQGLTSREIAEKLYLSASTVNTHRANMMQKLDIHDTASLVRFAIQEGVVKAEAAV
ncbi:MAG: response regulator transcription factor [Ignavibacteriales bacterium]|nr:response regulator transcription factor [Ignavibacteriales bacterium]